MLQIHTVEHGARPAFGPDFVEFRTFRWVSYSNVIGPPDFLEFSFGGGFSGQDWFQWVRDLSFHRRRVN